MATLQRPHSKQFLFGSKVASDSGGKSSIVTFGNPSNDALNELAAYGTSDIRVLRSLSTMDPQQCASLIKAACEETGAELVVFCHDYTGKSVAAMVAAKLGAGMVSGCH